MGCGTTDLVLEIRQSCIRVVYHSQRIGRFLNVSAPEGKHSNERIPHTLRRVVQAAKSGDEPIAQVAAVGAEVSVRQCRPLKTDAGDLGLNAAASRRQASTAQLDCRTATSALIRTPAHRRRRGRNAVPSSNAAGPIVATANRSTIYHSRQRWLSRPSCKAYPMAAHTDAHTVRFRGPSKTGFAERLAVGVLAVSGCVLVGHRRAGNPARVRPRRIEVLI